MGPHSQDPRIARKNTEKGLPDELANDVLRVAHGEIELGPVLVRVLEANLTAPASRYWTARLCEAAYEVDDAPAMLAVLGTASVDGSHSAARKALRLIDFRTFGPPIKAGK